MIEALWQAQLPSCTALVPLYLLQVPKEQKGDAEWSVFNSNPLIGLAGGPAILPQQVRLNSLL